MGQEIKNIPINKLCLWTENPRDPIDANSSDYDIIYRAIQDDKKKWELDKLIEKMGTYYDFSELPTVVEVDNKYIVYDGNRRLAIIKCLQNQELYSQTTGQLFLKYETQELEKLTKIPCNLCDKETALNNIERKHVNNGSWSELDRDYFMHIHRGTPKSIFIAIEEQTGLISNNNALNQRFVNEEVLTLKNLSDIGFQVNDDRELISNYDDETTKKIFSGITDLINNKIIDTRKNRGKLKEPLITQYPGLKEVVREFDNTRKAKIVLINNKKNTNNNQRKTPTTKSNEIIFGKSLALKHGKVNDLYRAIYIIYDKHKDDVRVYPILGMSLRLILDIAGRTYFKDKNNKIANEDQTYIQFLSQVKRDITLEKSDINFTALDDECFCFGKYNLF